MISSNINTGPSNTKNIRIILQNQEEGYALISVIVILILVTAIAVATLTRIRDVSEEGREEVLAIKTRALEDAGIARTLYALTVAGDPLGAEIRHDRKASFMFDSQQIELKFWAESGKFDLNTAPIPVLKKVITQIFQAPDIGLNAQYAARLEFKPSEIEVLIQDETDFVDRRLDALRQRGHKIFSPGELLSPSGQLLALKDCLSEQTTIFTGSDGIDPLLSTDITLRALPEITKNQVESILAAQAQGSLDALAQLPSATTSLFVREAPVYTIEARIDRNHEASIARRATASIDPERQKLSILSWTDAPTSCPLISK